MSEQCYFNGDFWQCVTATTAGQSPTTTAASWRKIALLNKWRWVLAQLTYANLLRLDGQTDKATVAMSIAYGRERTGLDELVRQEANEEGHRGCHRGREARVNTGRTRPVKASVILDDAYRLIGWDADQLDEREKQDARAALSQAVQEVWEAWWWQELMTTELQDLSPLAADNRTEDLTWTEQETGYRSMFQVTGLTVGETYRLGRDAVVQMSTGYLGFAGQYAPFGSVVTLPDDADYYFVAANASYRFWSSATTPASGSVTDALYQPAITLTTPSGPIRSVSKFDPRASANPQHFELDVTEDGTRVIGLTVGRPWVWARRVTPVIAGDDFDSTATYEATDPEDLVYDA